MAEEEGEGVAIVADGITLKAISLLLVGDTELDSAPSLKTEHLLVDADPLPRYPFLCCVVVKLVKETLHLPQWILCSLLLGIFAEVEHAHKMLKVLPLLETLNSSPSLRELLAHCTCNEVIAIECVTLKPHAIIGCSKRPFTNRSPIIL
jgi:hypothetical protein